MRNNLRAFQIKVGDKISDYRLGKQLNLGKIRTFFENRYKVLDLYSGGRHVFGTLEKESELLFLKLATTEGISAVTENEYNWNQQFNRQASRQTSDFWVPQNKDCGLYNSTLFYLITDKFYGELLAPGPGKVTISATFLNYLPAVIKFSEFIQKLNITRLPNTVNPDHRKYFLEKTKSWYSDIPQVIREKYKVGDLLRLIKDGLPGLQRKPRHGDFTPWHLVRLDNGKLGLLDGEHTLENGVEYYDIGYFIQRVFSVLKNPYLAENILSMLIKRKYSIKKLRVILAARVIGGYLDESLKISPNYAFSNKFRNWVLSITQRKIGF